MAEHDGDVKHRNYHLAEAKSLFEHEGVEFPAELATEKYRRHLNAALRNTKLDPEKWLSWIDERIKQAEAGPQKRESPGGLDDEPSSRELRLRKAKKKPKVEKSKLRRDQIGITKVPVVLLPDPALDQGLQHFCECHRRLWNELLQRNFAEYKQSKQFISLKEMASDITKMRQDEGRFSFAADLPSDACWDLAAELDKALSSKPVPTFRKPGSRGYFYLRDVKVGVGEVKLARLERIKFRLREFPQGRIVGAYIQRDGSGWRAVLRIKSRAQIGAEISDAP